MPITPAYKWQEDEATVSVEVALRNGSRNQVDILSTECFLKVNSAPYLLQVDLFGDVDDKRSTAVVSETGVTFTLQKTVKGLWGRLTAEGEKQDILEKRQRSLEASREAGGKRKEEAKRLKERTNKLALEKQWALEEAKKQTLERRKAEELRTAQEDLLSWQRKTAAQTNSSRSLQEGPVKREGEARGGASDGSDEAEIPSDDSDSFIPANSGRAAIEEIDGSDEETEETRVRSHSTRRNSGAAQSAELVTISKQPVDPGLSGLLTGGLADVANSADVADSADVAENAPSLVARSTRRLQQPPSEKQPERSLDNPKDADKENEQKGDNLNEPAKKNSTGGVVPAVVPAAVLPPPRRKMVVPVQFTAKELRPNVPARESRLKEIELKKAQSTAGDEDAVDISERQPAFLKDKGDAFYRSGDYEGAISAYTRAIEKDPAAALCFSNRGACHLRLGRLDECVSDCTTAVDLLQQRLEECEDETDGPNETSGKRNDVDAAVVSAEDASCAVDGLGSSAGARMSGDNIGEGGAFVVAKSGACGAQGNVAMKSGNATPAEAPSDETEMKPIKTRAPSERQRIHTALVKALVRRAAAQCEKGALNDSLADYEKALRLDPLNRSIEKDLQAVRDSVNPPTQSEFKARGDGFYKQGDIEGAAEAYTRAIESELQDPSVTRACISNRSACFVRLGKFEKSADDCTQAISLLGRPRSFDDGFLDEGLQSDISGSQASLKLLSRRGMAYGHLKKYADATRDLAAALKLAKSLGDLETAADLEQDISLLQDLQARQEC